MQGASASCDAGDVSDPPNPHPPALLRRPSFSLELYNCFSESALNAALSNDPSYDNIEADIDMDIDNNIEINILAGSSLARDNCDPSIVSRNSLGSDEGKPRRDRKRAGDGDSILENDSNKRIMSGKSSDAIKSVNDATSINASSDAMLGTRGSYLNYKYSNKDKPPFTIQVQSVDDAGPSSLHPLQNYFENFSLVLFSNFIIRLGIRQKR